jgi:hypothetical protein
MKYAILATAGILAVVLPVAIADSPAHAQPTAAPPSSPQFFFWTEGGWSTFDLAKVHAYDRLADTYFLDIKSGGYVRGEAAIAPVQRFGPIDTISIAFGYRTGSADDAAGDGDLTYVFPPINVGAGDFGPTGHTTAEQDFRLLDIQLRLKHTSTAWPLLNLNAEPFLARLTHNISASVHDVGPPYLTVASRTADLTGHTYGLQFAIEAQHQLTGTLTLRGRASLGGYHTRANGNFSFNVGGSPMSENSLSKSLRGFRAGAEIGADFRFTQNLLFGVTAGIDHWSSIPFPRLSTEAHREPIRIESRRFTDYFVGARLSVAFGDH